jgi:hypothetical protein
MKRSTVDALILGNINWLLSIWQLPPGLVARMALLSIYLDITLQKDLELHQQPLAVGSKASIEYSP